MMKKRLSVRCHNTGQTHQVPLGSTLEEVYRLIGLHMPWGATSAKVNNKVEGLHYVLFTDKDVEFLDITSSSGMRTYTRSLFFVLYKAVRDLYPTATLRISTPVSRGYFCYLQMEGGQAVTPDVVSALRCRMQEIIDARIPFHHHTCPTEEAVALFLADSGLPFTYPPA